MLPKFNFYHSPPTRIIGAGICLSCSLFFPDQDLTVSDWLITDESSPQKLEEAKKELEQRLIDRYCESSPEVPSLHSTLFTAIRAFLTKGEINTIMTESELSKEKYSEPITEDGKQQLTLLCSQVGIPNFDYEKLHMTNIEGHLLKSFIISTLSKD